MASTADFEDAISDAVNRLRDLRSGPPDTPDLAAVQGEGSALDDQISVVVGADGRLQSVTIAREAVHTDPRVLGDELMAATNAALDDLRDKYAQAAQEPAPDAEDLVDRLQEVQRTSLARLDTFLRTLTEAHLRAGQQRG